MRLGAEAWGDRGRFSAPTRLAALFCVAVAVVACGGGGRAADGGALDGQQAEASVDSDAPDAPFDAGSVDAEPDSGPMSDAALDSGGDAMAPAAPAVMALNLHCLDQTGTPYADVGARMEAVAAEAARDGVVALLLEEVCDDGATRALDVLRAALERATGGTWAAEERFAHVAWEGTPMEAQESVAILARTGIADPREVVFVAQGALRRVGLLVTLGPPLNGLRLMVVHLDHRDAAARLVQARESAVAALASVASGGALVGGDLNARVGSPPVEAFSAMGFQDLGATLPTSRIDHLLLHRGAAFEASGTRLVFDTAATAVSDHPGIVTALAPRSAPALSWTRVVARVDVGPGHWLSLRGDRAPLDWTSGWPMFALDGSTWVFSTAEIDAPFEYKVLVDDVTWMTGPNARGAAGVDNDVRPLF